VTGELSAHALGVARRRAGRGEWDPWLAALAHDLDVDVLIDQAVEDAHPPRYRP
jgi:hypothetical protein